MIHKINRAFICLSANPVSSAVIKIFHDSIIVSTGRRLWFFMNISVHKNCVTTGGQTCILLVKITMVNSMTRLWSSMPHHRDIMPTTLTTGVGGVDRGAITSSETHHVLAQNRQRVKIECI